MSGSIFGDTGVAASQVSAMISPGIRAGVTIGPDLRLAAATATAIDADTLYAMPIPVKEAVSFVGMVMAVGTAVAAVSGKMALYRSAPRGLMGGLVEESATVLDLGSSAATNLQANFAAPIVLPVGYWWLACKFNGLAKPYTMVPGGLMGNGAEMLYGAPNLGLFVRAVGGTAAYTRATVASVYADPFPAAPTLTFGTGAPGVPIMGLVAA